MDQQSKVFINADYCYKGSINCSLEFRTNEIGTIDLVTDYKEKIATVSTMSELIKELTKINNNEYA